MNTLILHLPQQVDWSPEKWCASARGCAPNEFGTMMQQSNLKWVSVTPLDDALGEYEEEELIALQALVVNPKAFLVEWNDVPMLKSLLGTIPDDIGAVVDNDHGLITKLCSIRDLPPDVWLRATKYPDFSSH